MVVPSHVVSRQQQFPVPNVDDGWQRSVAVQQKIAVRQFGRAVGEVVDVEVGVELHHQRVGGAGQLVVDRQRPEVVAGQPQQEVALLQCLARRLPALPAPVGVIRQLLEGDRGQRPDLWLTP